MDVAELAPGLWRWTARHPEYGADVACFYVELDGTTVLVDPLVPADDAERFWRSLDADVERRGLPVAVVLTTRCHRRSADEVAARYGAEVDRRPAGVDVLPLDLPDEPGTPLWLAAHRAIAVGDALIEVGGELRLWWSFEGEQDRRLFEERYVPSLRRWLELPIEHVLCGHGAYVAGGREELARALERPPWEQG